MEHGGWRRIEEELDLRGGIEVFLIFILYDLTLKLIVNC